MPSLEQLLDADCVEGLALYKQPTGYTASVFFGVGDWSPREFATAPSDAIRKALTLHAPARPVAVLAPPPY